MPTAKLKPKGGALKGDRNAYKSGAHSAEFRDFGRDVALYVQLVKAALAPLRAILPPPKPRVVYHVVRPERC